MTRAEMVAFYVCLLIASVSVYSVSYHFLSGMIVALILIMVIVDILNEGSKRE